MQISLDTLKERLAHAVLLAKTSTDDPDRPIVHLQNTPTICDTPIKTTAVALSLHVVGFRDLHTDEQVRLAKEAMRAKYVCADKPEELHK